MKPHLRIARPVSDFARASAGMLAAGFRPVVSFNPYWAARGRTFEDPKGYRVLLQNAEWKETP